MHNAAYEQTLDLRRWRSETGEHNEEQMARLLAHLPQAKVILPVPALQSGYIHHMDTVGLGNTAQAMGAGRRTKEDVIDPSVGFVLHKRIGNPITLGEAIATVYAKDEESAQTAIAAIQQQVVITNEQVPPCKLIHAFVTDTSVEKY